MSDAQLFHEAARIIRMFELYSRQIDPDDPEFQAFIKHYLQSRDPREFEAIPHPELYKLIREGIRGYLRQEGKISPGHKK